MPPETDPLRVLLRLYADFFVRTAPREFSLPAWGVIDGNTNLFTWFTLVVVTYAYYEKRMLWVIFLKVLGVFAQLLGVPPSSVRVPPLPRMLFSHHVTLVCIFAAYFFLSAIIIDMGPLYKFAAFLKMLKSAP